MIQSEKNEQMPDYIPSRHLVSGFDWVASAVVALTVVALVFALAFRMVSVSGDSMMNTLQNGDRLLLSGVMYTPDYGDVVVIRRDNDSPLIKRVIGLAGDRIRIDEETGVVYRNDQPLTEPYVRGGVTPAYGMTDEITVPEGTIFAMGDNRSESLDSRILGPLPVEDVVGRAFFRLAPKPGTITNGE